MHQEFFDLKVYVTVFETLFPLRPLFLNIFALHHPPPSICKPLSADSDCNLPSYRLLKPCCQYPSIWPSLENETLTHWHTEYQ